MIITNPFGKRFVVTNFLVRRVDEVIGRETGTAIFLASIQPRQGLLDLIRFDIMTFAAMSSAAIFVNSRSYTAIKLSMSSCV